VNDDCYVVYRGSGILSRTSQATRTAVRHIS